MFQTSHSTWNPEWSETEHEVFRDYGFAAFKAQMLEGALFQVLLAAEYSGRISFEKRADVESDVFLSRKTMGQLFGELRKGGLDERTAAMLQDALDARNFLTHHFFRIHAKHFTTYEGRGIMLKELQDLRFRIGRSQDVFSQIREQVFEQIFGITRAEAERLYEEHLRTGPNAGGQTK